MKINPIIIIAGEPYGVFLELFFKIFRTKIIQKNKRTILLVGSKILILHQMKKFKYNFKINLINEKFINDEILDKSKINLINVDLSNIKNDNNTKNYIKECFNIGLSLMKKKYGFALINGPISKKKFLEKKFLGVTEYISHKTNSKKKEAMLIYGKKFSVSPITTHLPLKDVSKNINKNIIIQKITTINNFYKTRLNKKVKFAVCGLNPHCETIHKYSEEEKMIIPAIQILNKKKIIVDGPFSADTLFMKKNLKKYDVFIGMYHDQVLTPIKAILGFEAINVTLGIPFIRISPDHGPNFLMFGKNKSDPKSLIQSLTFLNEINDIQS